MRPKNQRLILVLLAMAAVIGAVLLAMWGLRDRAAYFVTPSDIAAGQVDRGRALRLGGMVERGSITRGAGSRVNFRVTDGSAVTPVRFDGLPPDLFREGSGVIAEGRLLADGSFAADTILAKHDETYMPPQLGNQAAGMRAAKTVEQ